MYSYPSRPLFNSGPSDATTDWDVLAGYPTTLLASKEQGNIRNVLDSSCPLLRPCHRYKAVGESFHGRDMLRQGVRKYGARSKGVDGNAMFPAQLDKILVSRAQGTHATGRKGN